MADLTLESFGDRELRVVKFTLPEGEAVIPVFIVYYRSGRKEFAKIAPAIGLYPEQATRLEYHFTSVNEWKKRDQFLIQRKHLDKLTETVSGITPAYYYRWPGKGVPMPSADRLKVNGEEIQPIPDDAEDFLDYVHLKRGIDRNVLRLAWTAVSKEAASWLLKKKKPINLGFVNIFAVPYRANWKEILLARFPNALWWFKSNVNKDGVFHDRLAQAAFQGELMSLALMAIHGRDHYIHWTMEAVPSEDWESDVADIEMDRKAGGNTSYVRFYEKTISDMLPKILQVFSAYIGKAVRSFPALKSGAVDGSKKFCPYRGKSDILPTYGKSIPVSVVLPDGPPKLREESQFQEIRPAFVRGLQNLSASSKRKPPVLGPEPDMDEPADGEDRDLGMRLCDVVESENSGQPMLSQPTDERANGLESAIDI